MGAINEFIDGSKSALMTLGFCMFPAGVALFPSLPSGVDFIPLSGDGNPEALVASIDLEALVSDKDVVAVHSEPTPTTGPDSQTQEETQTEDNRNEAVVPETPKPLPGMALSEKKVITPAQSKQVPPSNENQRATRSAQAQTKHDLAETVAKASTPHQKSGKGEGHANNKCVEANGHITQVNAHTFRIDQSIVDRYSSAAKASQLAAAAWDKNGRGLKIWKMGCKNPLRLAGLKNKDVIHSVNGIELTNSANAFRAWRKTRNQKNVKVVVYRKGKRQILTYKVS